MLTFSEYVIGGWAIFELVGHTAYRMTDNHETETAAWGEYEALRGEKINPCPTIDESQSTPEMAYISLYDHITRH